MTDVTSSSTKHARAKTAAEAAVVADVITAITTTPAAVTAPETAGKSRFAVEDVRMGTIETTDLALIPYRPGDLLALIEGAAEFRNSFGFPAADGPREFLLGPEVAPDYIDMLRSSTAVDVWRHGFAVIEKDSQFVVGNAAFVGPPDECGEVEIAYGIVPMFEGRGYATQAAKALADFAFSDSRVKSIRAHTLPEENASTRVLEKNGFTFVGELNHTIDGLVWRWEKKKMPSAPNSDL